MLAKRRNAGKSHQHIARLDRLKLPVMRIKMSDYEAYHHNKDRLKEVAELWLTEPLDLDATTDLESLRKLLTKDNNMDACCFLDCKCRLSCELSANRCDPLCEKHTKCGFCYLACTAERFFRIDRDQEQFHYVTDVAVEAVFILDEDAMQQQSEGQAGPSQIVANQEVETTQICLPRYGHFLRGSSRLNFSFLRNA